MKPETIFLLQLNFATIRMNECIYTRTQVIYFNILVNCGIYILSYNYHVFNNVINDKFTIYNYFVRNCNRVNVSTVMILFLAKSINWVKYDDIYIIIFIYRDVRVQSKQDPLAQLIFLGELPANTILFCCFGLPDT